MNYVKAKVVEIDGKVYLISASKPKLNEIGLVDGKIKVVDDIEQKCFKILASDNMDLDVPRISYGFITKNRVEKIQYVKVRIHPSTNHVEFDLVLNSGRVVIEKTSLLKDINYNIYILDKFQIYLENNPNLKHMSTSELEDWCFEYL